MQRRKKELGELRHELKTKLPKELEAARAHGDLRENAEYEACKERQGLLNARIGQIEQRIRDLSLYSINSIPRDAVGYGSQVTLENVDDGEIGRASCRERGERSVVGGSLKKREEERQ